MDKSVRNIMCERTLPNLLVSFQLCAQIFCYILIYISMYEATDIYNHEELVNQFLAEKENWKSCLYVYIVLQ